MDSLELQQIVNNLRDIQTDNLQVEVKSARNGFPKSTLETISAFANGQGGLLILGLDEENNFLPVPKLKYRALSDALSRACSQDLTPAVRARIEIVPFEGQKVVCAQIPALPDGERPCYLTDRGLYRGSYLSSHDGDHLLQKYEIDRLLEQRTQPVWDLEAICEASPADLDQEILQAILKRERELHPRYFAQVSDEVALRRLNILKEEQGKLHPTLAGLLVAGVYPQQFFPQLMISYAVYPGTKRSEAGKNRFDDSGTILGPIPVLVKETLEIVRKNMRYGAVVEGAYRKDITDYPVETVREAIVNALMHRDYSRDARGTQVQLNIFVDRLQILNPGGLYGAVTIDTLGKEGISSSRNQALARILEVTPYEDGGYVAENRGSGYPAMIHQLAENLQPAPIPRSTLTYFSLEFEKRKMTEAEQQAASGGSSKDRILNYLAENLTATSRELAAAAGIGLGGTRRIINQLVKAGIIIKTEPSSSPRQRYKKNW